MNDKVSINKLIQTDNLSFEKFVEEDRKNMSHVLPAVGFLPDMDNISKRKKRNRESAINHRKRKKRYITGLESIVKEMKCKMAKLMSENEILKEQIDTYEIQKFLPDLNVEIDLTFFEKN